jgi:hypothetical protein
MEFKDGALFSEDAFTGITKLTDVLQSQHTSSIPKHVNTTQCAWTAQAVTPGKIVSDQGAAES